MGVDFLGGRAYVVRFAEPQQPAALKVALPAYVEGSSVEVKTFGDDRTLKITTNYLVKETHEESDQQVRTQLIKGLEETSQLQHQPTPP